MAYERFLAPEIFFSPEIYTSDFLKPLPVLIDGMRYMLDEATYALCDHLAWASMYQQARCKRWV